MSKIVCSKIKLKASFRATSARIIRNIRHTQKMKSEFHAKAFTTES